MVSRNQLLAALLALPFGWAMPSAAHASCEKLLPQTAVATRRAVTPENLAELRDIGVSEVLISEPSPLALSPDGRQIAFVLSQADPAMPDGSSLQIDNVPATDAAGYAGLADKVDPHTWALLKGVALSTLLGVGSSLTFTGESDLVQAIRESTQQSVSRAGDQLTSKNLNIQPTHHYPTRLAGSARRASRSDPCAVAGVGEIRHARTETRETARSNPDKVGD